MSQLKVSTTIVNENIHVSEDGKRVVADVQGSKLKALLNNLKK